MSFRVGQSPGPHLDDSEIHQCDSAQNCVERCPGDYTRCFGRHEIIHLIDDAIQLSLPSCQPKPERCNSYSERWLPLRWQRLCVTLGDVQIQRCGCKASLQDLECRIHEC